MKFYLVIDACPVQAGNGGPMAFVRKRGNSYYLVHNVRRDGRIQQLHLARLGSSPRIDDNVIRGVSSKHPFLRVDWNHVKERVSRDFLEPIQNDSDYLRGLISDVRNVHFNIAGLHLPGLEVARDHDLRTQLITELKLLRGTLDVKLNSYRKVNPLNRGMRQEARN
jgi:hypothetical protein